VENCPFSRYHYAMTKLEKVQASLEALSDEELEAL
jgi:hypothetical protein